ncbi:unnamed protein product [Auanema sp. JU1783]|nr:unnamed protein product [Auanema sp. JU1783]
MSENATWNHERRRQKSINRAQRMRARLVPWSIALLVLTVEIFLLSSFFGKYFLYSLIPSKVIIVLEWLVLLHVFTTNLWLAYKSLPESSTEIRYKKRTSEQSNTSVLDKSLNTSRKADSSWVESHSFGFTSSRIFSHEPSSSTPRSNHGNVPLDVSSDGLISPIYHHSNASPYSKSVDSIHTRDQLDRLLRKSTDESRGDLSTSFNNSSISYFNLLDASGSEKKPYQLSEASKADKKDGGVVRIDSSGRVYLSPVPRGGDGDMDDLQRLKVSLMNVKNTSKKTGSPLLRRSESNERRRRSFSIADGSISSVSSSPKIEMSSSLDEERLLRGEQLVRVWISNSILSTLSVEIKNVNKALEEDHTTLRIGSASVEALKTALISKEKLKSTTLPYLLPYLSFHTNQAYLVSRILEFSADPFISNFSWNSGGTEPVSEESVNGRIARRAWSDSLPTDSALLFHIFCTYMDSKVTSNPLVGSASLSNPFSAVYTLISPQKPSAIHNAPGSFYIHMSSASPPQFELVHTDSNGVTSRTVVAKGPNNFFRTIVHFIYYAKVYNESRIDVMNIGKTGLNLACILEA